jgi:alkylation response protein AidB-like acyl-CoA dehydrogenase
MSEKTISELVASFLDDHPVGSLSETEFRGARFDEGLALPQFEKGYGGLNLEPAAYLEAEQLFLAAGAADHSGRNVVGLGMAAPTLHAYGTEAQKQLLRPLFTGEHIWCQLFSEPGAGSDLAGISTRAEACDDGWFVNGQKVGSSLDRVDLG